MKIINTKIKLSPVVETTYEYTYDWRGDRTETETTEHILLEAVIKRYFLGITVVSLKYFINFPNNGLDVGSDIHRDVKNLLDNKKTNSNLSSIKIEYHPQEITPFECMSHFSSIESAEQTIDYMEKYPHLFTLLYSRY